MMRPWRLSLSEYLPSTMARRKSLERSRGWRKARMVLEVVGRGERREEGVVVGGGCDGRWWCMWVDYI